VALNPRSVFHIALAVNISHSAACRGYRTMAIPNRSLHLNEGVL